MISRAWLPLPANLKRTFSRTTNAVFGFTNMFRKSFVGQTPASGAVVFDALGPTFRAQKYPSDKNVAQPSGPDVRMVDTLRDVPYDADLVL